MNAVFLSMLANFVRICWFVGSVSIVILVLQVLFGRKNGAGLEGRLPAFVKGIVMLAFVSFAVYGWLYLKTQGSV